MRNRYDELEVLRELFDQEFEPGAHTWTTVTARLEREMAEECSSYATGRHSAGRRLRSLKLAIPVAAALLLLGAVSITVFAKNASSPHAIKQSLATNRTWKLAAFSTPAWAQQSTIGSSPYTLTCPTTSTCYATGPSEIPSGTPSSGLPPSILEVTHNGGTTWSASSLPLPDIQFTGVSCPSEDTCMLGGSTIVDGSGTQYLFTTTNGGAHWTYLPIPDAIGLSNLALSCASTSACVAIDAGPGPDGQGVEDTSYATSNGGVTWSHVSLPGTFRTDALQCPSADDCVATGQAPGAYRVTDPMGTGGFAGSGAVAYTTNGGLSWARGSVPSPQFTIAGLSCSDASHCVALNTNNLITKPISTVAIFTDDGGASWTTSTIDESTSLNLSSTACSSSIDCWATGDSLSQGVVTSSSGSSSPVIFATSDRGETWTSSPLPAAQGATSTSVGEISCPSTTECLALEYQNVPGSSTNADLR